MSENYFSGISGAFWSLTFSLICFSLIVAVVGGDNLVRVLLGVMATYAVVGMAYGGWAARKAVQRA